MWSNFTIFHFFHGCLLDLHPWALREQPVFSRKRASGVKETSAAGQDGAVNPNLLDHL